MSTTLSPARLRFISYACFAVTLVAGTSGTLLGPAFQSMSQRFTIPLEDSGMFTGLQFTGITLSILATGRLLDRIDARWALMGSSALIGAGLLLIAVAGSVPVALVGAFVLGLGYGIADVAANVVIARINSDRAGAALSLLAFFYGLGAVLGPQLLSVALAWHNFTLAFIGVAALSLLLTVPFWWASLPIDHESHAAASRSAASIRWIILLPFALLLFTYVGAEVGYSSWIVTQLTLAARSAAETATVAASLFWLGLTIARALASVALHRLSETQVLRGSIVIVILGVALLLALSGSPAAGLVSAFVVGFGCGPIFPVSLALAGNIYPESRGTTSGVMMAAGTLGGALLPWLQGQIGAGRDGGMIAVLVAAVAMLVIQAFKPGERAAAGGLAPGK